MINNNFENLNTKDNLCVNKKNSTTHVFTWCLKDSMPTLPGYKKRKTHVIYW